MRWADRPSIVARAAARIPREAPPKMPWYAIVLAALVAPAMALAHERWIPNQARFPVNRAYFQSMTGEVLAFSIAASVAIAGLIVFWYLTAPGILERLTPVTDSDRAREAQRGFFSRSFRGLVRFALDGESTSPFMTKGLKVAAFVFSKIPAFVLLLGAYQGWLVMPSYPLDNNDLGTVFRVTEVVLAIWVATGLFKPVLGAVLFVVYVYLCAAYGVAGVDAIPVLASAFFYLFAKKGVDVNARQLLGMRLSLGIGFFLLGLVNKILLGPDLFIGVGDQHPDLLIGPQAMFPGLTRETWCFATALGEMVFGLLLLVGTFNRITTLVLSFVFGNFMLVFGWAEIVHVYPIAGFVLLFFRGQSGTSLDGLVFRANVGFWRRLRHSPAAFVYACAASLVAGLTGAFGMFTPLFAITEIIPSLVGLAVPANYKPPPEPPPAAQWANLPAMQPKPHADHEPRHGGLVTMTGDNHVEMVVRRDGYLQLYISDAVRAPIDPRQASGSVVVERPGLKQSISLAPDATGALAAMAPAPVVATDYTYVLKIRGVASSQTLRVQAGGTAAPRK